MAPYRVDMSKGLTPLVLFKAFHAPLGVLFFTLMIVVDAAFGMYMPRLNGQVLDSLVQIDDPMVPIHNILTFTGLALAQYIMNSATGYVITVLDRRMTLRLRSLWLKRVLDESHWIEGVYGGGKLVGMYNMQKAFESSVGQLLSSIKSILNLIFVYYVVLWEYDRVITILFVVQPLFAFGFSQCTAPLKFRWTKELQEYGTENADHSTVILSNLKQASTNKQAVESHLHSRWRTLYRKELFVQRILGIGLPFVVMLWMLTTTMWMYFHCLYAIADGAMSLGDVVTLMQYKTMNQGAIFSFVGLYMKWQGLKSTWDVMGTPFRRSPKSDREHRATLERPIEGGWRLSHPEFDCTIKPLERHSIQDRSNENIGSSILQLLVGCDEHGALTKGWCGENSVDFKFLAFEPSQAMKDVVDSTAPSNLQQRMSLMRAMQGDMVLIDHTLDVFERDEAHALFERLCTWCETHQKTLVVSSRQHHRFRDVVSHSVRLEPNNNYSLWNVLRAPQSLFGRNHDSTPNHHATNDTDSLLRHRGPSRV